MDLAERGDEPEPDAGRLARRQRAVLDHHAFEGAAHHQLHDDPQAFALVDDVVDPHHVRVVDPRRRPRLAQRPLTAGTGVLGVQAVYAHLLDGDGTVEHFVGRPPHPPHSPLADTLDQPIAPCHQ